MPDEIKVKRRISEHDSRPHIAEIDTEDVEDSLIQIEYPKSIEFRPNNAEWDGDDDWSSSDSNSSSDGNNQSIGNQPLEISDEYLGMESSSRSQGAVNQSERGLMLMKYSDSSLVSFHDVLDLPSTNIESRSENSSRPSKEEKSKSKKIICYNLFIQMSYCEYSLRIGSRIITPTLLRPQPTKAVESRQQI